MSRRDPSSGVPVLGATFKRLTLIGVCPGCNIEHTVGDCPTLQNKRQSTGQYGLTAKRTKDDKTKPAEKGQKKPADYLLGIATAVEDRKMADVKEKKDQDAQDALDALDAQDAQDAQDALDALGALGAQARPFQLNGSPNSKITVGALRIARRIDLEGRTKEELLQCVSLCGYVFPHTYSYSRKGVVELLWRHQRFLKDDESAVQIVGAEGKIRSLYDVCELLNGLPENEWSNFRSKLTLMGAALNDNMWKSIKGAVTESGVASLLSAIPGVTSKHVPSNGWDIEWGGLKVEVKGLDKMFKSKGWSSGITVYNKTSRSNSGGRRRRKLNFDIMVTVQTKAPFKLGIATKRDVEARLQSQETCYTLPQNVKCKKKVAMYAKYANTHDLECNASGGSKLTSVKLTYNAPFQYKDVLRIDNSEIVTPQATGGGLLQKFPLKQGSEHLGAVFLVIPHDSANVDAKMAEVNRLIDGFLLNHG